MPKPNFFTLFLFFFHINFSLFPHISNSQKLSASQSQTLIRLRRILEYPPSLQSWNRYTSFCNLPSSSSFSISCSSSGQINKLYIAGNGASRILSGNFSSDSLFTTLSRLNNLKSLSLVDLGIWGPLPAKIKRMSFLESLNLSSNYLNGTFPDFKSMAVLSELDLSRNFLGFEFPSLGNSIRTLVLRRNRIRGEFSGSFALLDRLQKLDLSFNEITGLIPSSLFSVSSIRYLDLSDNKLRGTLPVSLSCGGNLSFVDISMNFLVGDLPSCVRSNSSDLIVFCSWNCLLNSEFKDQHPVSYCMKKPLAAILPESNEKVGSKIDLRLVLGILGGIIGGVLVIGLILLLFLRKVKPEINGGKFLNQPSDFSHTFVVKKTPADARHMSQGVIIGTLGITPYRVFNMEEIEEATNGFDLLNLVSDGRQGQFFKGLLHDGSKILVRSLKLNQKISSQNLLQHIDIISKLRHRHLVSVLGHCILSNGEGNANTPSIVFLVFEYVSNGTLRNHLTEWRKREMLKWPQRVTAVIGVAKGLQFLHTVMALGLSGHDLKIENILLDETLTAKISNYNLPLLPKSKNKKIDCEIPFDVREDGNFGNFGSFQNFENGEKEDIYQLGLILLEVITGKPIGSKGELDAVRAQLLKNLNESPAKVGAIVDPGIQNTFAYDSLRRAVEISINCVSKDPKERPSIDDILWNLQYCIQIQDGWASSENLSTQS